MKHIVNMANWFRNEGW